MTNSHFNRASASSCSGALKLLFAALVLVLFCHDNPALAQNFGGAFEGMANSDEPIQIEADRLEVEDSKGVASFNGNVNVVQAPTILKATWLKVYYISGGGNGGGPNSNIKRIEAGGKVAVRSGDQTATADNMIYDAQKETVSLSGDVSVSQGNNIVTGCSLFVNLKNNAAKLEPCRSASKSQGRVKMLFTPGSVSQ